MRAPNSSSKIVTFLVRDKKSRVGMEEKTPRSSNIYIKAGAHRNSDDDG